jgi:hypothetical protein
LWILDGHVLGDGATQGQPDDVRARLAEVIQQRHGICGHVCKAVMWFMI